MRNWHPLATVRWQHLAPVIMKSRNFTARQHFSTPIHSKVNVSSLLFGSLRVTTSVKHTAHLKLDA
ncbi:hypothetical protein M378DRAFT_967344 [Amanita muscaria Koide BX008]|uniref:Uncharacterized protein n=1 Tax=Amanita muscaria (strain Koide BX008) TaxID=946122 RepID=A0A0C2WEI2_AMAMK|nr:hypothetical protein M378DRAFT_967344 [Amanita muscaria Koide BX008]